MEIRPQEGIKPISDFRKDTSRILKELRQKREPILITQRGRSVAVLLDLSTYEQLEYAAHLRASYLRGAKDLKEGRKQKHAYIIRTVEARNKE
ncbi:MAG: type II toxin-antitoxin system Phd/YefM family antitoxin [Elusimicrobia bacterium]|nr:type II toxin-antitoxin system Phd/YefM family antitoxin [Elusimicrobiota bacterium]